LWNGTASDLLDFERVRESGRYQSACVIEAKPTN
jgi:hypothetical protein